MSKHSDRPKSDQAPGAKHGEGQKETTNRHVFVEPGVKIDYVDDIKQEDKTRYGDTKAHQQRQLRWTKIAAGLVAAYTLVMLWQACLTKNIVSKTDEQIVLSRNQFAASHRPWIKIAHGVIEPLTFDAPGAKGPLARLLLEETLTNVGETVALDVFSWEEIVLLDDDRGWASALARRSQYCDTNRHPDRRSLSGYVMFPNDPMNDRRPAGIPMEAVRKAAARNKDGVVGFALVGCVFYRFPFEEQSAATHQTRFIYLLGKVVNGGFVAWYPPVGTIPNFQLMTLPTQWTAD